jgi:hypothetical protein
VSCSSLSRERVDHKTIEESNMGRKILGCVMFLGVASLLFEVAGRLASEQRAGWGWFLFAGLMISGIALNLWTGEVSTPRCPCCKNSTITHDLE